MRTDHRRNARLLVAAPLMAVVFAVAARAQAQEPPGAPQERGRTPPQAPEAPEMDAPAIAAAIASGIEFLLAGQHRDGQLPCSTGFFSVVAEGGLPIGYRVGGTALCALALVRAPGYADSAERQAAVLAATRYVTASVEHPFMAHDFATFRDVHHGEGRSGHPADRTFYSGQRAWAYAYGLQYLLELRREGLLPCDPAEAERAIRFFLDGIAETEIATGGWDYLADEGRSRLAVIVTVPTLQALYEARRQRFEFDHAMVDRALKALERTRSPRGTWPYSGLGGPNLEPQSSSGRTLACECALVCAGRSSVERLRAAIDGFFAHWEWLEKQRGSRRPHAPPYMISTYYFFYAHYYAAMAIELLPAEEREAFRRQLVAKLAAVRLAGGAWSDQVDQRPQLYGTAMAILVLSMPEWSAGFARWEETSRER